MATESAIRCAGLGPLKPYSEMKDPGVEWLGDMPSHWEVRRLSDVADMRVSNVTSMSSKAKSP